MHNWIISLFVTLHLNHRLPHFIVRRSLFVIVIARPLIIMTFSQRKILFGSGIS